MWYCRIDEKSTGPLTEQELYESISLGKVLPITYIWKPGMNKWLLAKDHPELKNAFQEFSFLFPDYSKNIPKNTVPDNFDPNEIPVIKENISISEFICCLLLLAISLFNLFLFFRGRILPGPTAFNFFIVVFLIAVSKHFMSLSKTIKIMIESILFISLFVLGGQLTFYFFRTPDRRNTESALSASDNKPRIAEKTVTSYLKQNVAQKNMEKLKQALEEFKKQTGVYPMIFSKNQKKPDKYNFHPHSWRVHLLPFLGEKELFENIKLYESWDSDWNKQFHSKMPNIFYNPDKSNTRETGMTAYKLVGDVSEKKSLIRLYEYKFYGDNNVVGSWPNNKNSDLKNSAILLEEDPPVCWMDPYGDLCQSDLSVIQNKDDKNKKKQDGFATDSVR